MTNVTDETLGRLARQQHELFQRVRKGTLDANAVFAAHQALIEGKGLQTWPLVSQAAGSDPGAAPLHYPARDFSRYDQYLLPLGDQLELLRDLNRRMPSGLCVSEAWLDLDTVSGHVQSVEGLEHFFTVFDTVEKTLAFSWELIKLTQPAHYHSGFKTDARNLCLGPNTRWYEPGVHRVRVNLVDNWAPEKRRSVDQVRDRIAGTDALLASVEPVGAYGLHAQLFRQQNGTDLPYTDLAGLRQGRGLGLVPGLDWDGKAYLFSFGSVDVDGGSAAPSLQGVQS